MKNELKIGVVGSGAMGSGIAQVAATSGHSVFVYDTSEVALSKAKQSESVNREYMLKVN